MNIVVTLSFMLLDILTGLVKAFKTKSFTSSVMKEGLFSKLGSIILILLGVLGEWSIKYVDLGITVPLITAFCSYICLMELGSIIENLGTINPLLVPTTIKKYFTKLKED